MRRIHLNDDNFAGWAIDPGYDAAIEHFEICGECRREAIDFRRAVTAFRSGLYRAAEDRELRWVRPEAADAPRNIALGRAWRLIPVAVLAVFLLAVAIARRAPKPAPPAASIAADNALMIQIQSDLNRQEPEALAPAEALFADASAAQSPEYRSTMNGGTP